MNEARDNFLSEDFRKPKKSSYIFCFWSLVVNGLIVCYGVVKELFF